MSEERGKIPCPGCGGYLRLNNDTLRFAHEGPHDPDCNFKSVEPINFQVITAYKRGMWRFTPDGKVERTPTPPISGEQFGNSDNVINVDFKNKKRIE